MEEEGETVLCQDGGDGAGVGVRGVGKQNRMAVHVRVRARACVEVAEVVAAPLTVVVLPVCPPKVLGHERCLLEMVRWLCVHWLWLLKVLYVYG